MPKGRQSPSSSSSPTPSASSRVSRLAGMLMLIPALVSASPRAGQTDSVASAQPSQASFGPLMSGFVDQPSSPYHFGAKDPVYDPPPSTPSPPGSTAERLSRIRQQARTVPDVPGAESAWREHISSLRSREGVVQESLSEAMGYISNGISAEISGGPRPGGPATRRRSGPTWPPARSAFGSTTRSTPSGALCRPLPRWFTPCSP